MTSTRLCGATPLPPCGATCGLSAGVAIDFSVRKVASFVTMLTLEMTRMRVSLRDPRNVLIVLLPVAILALGDSYVVQRRPDASVRHLQLRDDNLQYVA